MITLATATSRFGSHESVCKYIQPNRGQCGVQGVETNRIKLMRRNLLKVGVPLHHAGQVDPCRAEKALVIMKML